VQLQPNPPSDGEIPSFFTLGSDKNEVLLVQGTPTRVDGNKWFYTFSEIQFKDNRVSGYDNYFGNLSIRILPSYSPVAVDEVLQRGYFTIGSSKDEVLTVQGTPTSIQGNFWFYRLSNVLFRNGKVQYVVNSDGNLHFIPPEEIANSKKQSR
jgi:outer membrane protein assembly factor BamE (lipoprotein component of BamABCDE complex)